MATKTARANYNTVEGQKQLMALSMGLPADTCTRKIKPTQGDYGADPLGDGMFRMVPSGDVLDFAERQRRLGY